MRPETVRFESLGAVHAKVFWPSTPGEFSHWSFFAGVLLNASQLRLKAFVTRSNVSYYVEQCNIKGPTAPYGLWHMIGDDGHIDKLWCDFGPAGTAPFTTRPANMCSAYACEVPRALRARLPGLSRLNMTIVGEQRDEEGMMRTALAAEMSFRRVTVPRARFVACSHMLYNVHALERAWPGIIEVWLRWYFDVLGFDRFFLYDIDGSLGPYLQELALRRDGTANKVLYSPRFADAVAGVHLRGFWLPNKEVYGMTAEILCSRPNLLQMISHEHCMSANAQAAEWVTNVHAPDLFLVPPAWRAGSRKPNELRIEQLLAQWGAADRSSIRIRSFESGPAFRVYKPNWWFAAPDNIHKLLYKSGGRLRNLCRHHPNNSVELLFDYHSVRIETPNYPYCMCRVEAAWMFTPHGCLGKEYPDEGRTWSSVMLPDDPTDWHYRHLSLIHQPFDCTSPSETGRLNRRLMTKPAILDPFVPPLDFGPLPLRGRGGGPLPPS